MRSTCNTEVENLDYTEIKRLKREVLGDDTDE
jgi:hypothetical protein